MKRLMISSIAAIALLAAATSILRAQSPSAGRPAGMGSMQELRATTDVSKLPNEGVDDQSLVFSKTRR